MATYARKNPATPLIFLVEASFIIHKQIGPSVFGT